MNDSIKFTQDMRDVMIAYIQGKRIQVKAKNEDWWEVVEKPVWDFHHCEYRVKPEESRELWIVLYGKLADWSLTSMVFMDGKDAKYYAENLTKTGFIVKEIIHTMEVL